MAGIIVQASPAVILSGQTTSQNIDLNEFTLCAISTPAALTGTALTFFAAESPTGTFNAVKDTPAGAVITFTVAASGYYVILPATLTGIRWLRIVSNSAEAATRTIFLMARHVD